ncbi:MAG: cytochrome c-type biosis protein CcmF [Thermoleophilaceae bacterium]|jgi:cytochrome c-type biogenesis protein CcmF|nr:cytochrome c-type biosis protein CcmF [Thermoleophilaceae bacterium]
MAGVGSACLAIALLTALYSAGASIFGARTGRREWVTSGRRAIYCVAALCVAAFGLLEAAFLRSDFSYALVAEGSSTDTPTFYKVTALWATQDGSLLLWATLLSLFASAVLFLTRRSLRDIAPYATAVLGCIAAFFLLLMVGWENPFDTLAAPPAEGAGLNPLLRHPAMMIHPPMLYTGYVGFSIPFAFAIGALVAGRTGADWIRATRRFALIAWTFLGTGIMLGALWSYTELGWGGYWAWDPVENASLMPWLVGTAFLHSIMVQEKRGMLKIWNVSLICATFTLALLGTFLVRSGILSSIHAFGASTIGVQFLIFIGLVIALSAGLIISRLPLLRSEAKLDSLLSREAFFLLNNLVLVGLCLVIMWGTFFPLISEAITGTEASVGPPWFNRLVTPLALVLVLLTGIGPVLAWRRFTPAALRRVLWPPVSAAALALVLLLAFTNAADSPASLAMFCLVAFVLTVVSMELARGTKARRTMTGESWPRALGRLTGRNRRRYGGYLVHAGIAVLFLGVAGSSAFLDQRDVRLKPGDSFGVNGYQVTYREATAKLGGDSAGTGAPISFGAVLDVRKDGEHFVMRPSRNYYASGDPSLGTISRFFEGEATSEVDVRWGLKRDLWLAVQPDIGSLEKPIQEADAKFANSPGDVQALIIAALAERYRSDPPPAAFRAIASPLVAWIWLGGAIVVLGALVAAWPSPEARLRRVRSLYSARLGRDLSRA